MKALMYRTFGPPESLVVEDVPPPQPAANEVQIRVRAAGINFPDSLIIQNLYQIKPPLPFSPGGELAGEITAVGVNVKSFAVGQSVIAFTGWGGFAEYAVVDSDRLIPYGQKIRNTWRRSVRSMGLRVGRLGRVHFALQLTALG